MNFSQALEQLAAGKMMRRSSWDENSPVQRIYLVPGSTFVVSRAPLNKFYAEGTQITYREHIDAAFSDGTCGVWAKPLESTAAEDWVIVGDV